MKDGGSLRAMREYFTCAKRIVGIDIMSKCKQEENVSKNIFVEVGDASSEKFLSSVYEK